MMTLDAMRARVAAQLRMDRRSHQRLFGLGEHDASMYVAGKIAALQTIGDFLRAHRNEARRKAVLLPSKSFRASILEKEAA